MSTDCEDWRVAGPLATGGYCWRRASCFWGPKLKKNDLRLPKITEILGGFGLFRWFRVVSLVLGGFAPKRAVSEPFWVVWVGLLFSGGPCF